ncbi:MAG: hypothetical protein M3R43_10750, partial [Acidobacteriota bacterium]|nr:hypothetical protein [Acidobacteriota bacterium]
MTLKHFFAYLLFISALTSASVANADDVAVTQRLVRATDASSLDSLTTKPWHAKLAVTVFDAKGKNPVEGTVEYWKAGEDWLRLTTIGSTTETLLRHDGHSYRSEGSSDVPYLATAALDEFLHPGPTQNEIEASKPELRKQNFGKVSLDCIMLSQPLKRVAFAPLGLFPTYCLD